MIAVKVSEDNYIYDIHSLVKAFYPAEDVKVSGTESSDLLSSDGLPAIFVYPDKDSLRITLHTAEADNRERDVLEEKEEGLDYDNRPAYKNALKKTLYRLLKKYTGRDLPWGTLTGIRPTKIAMGMIEDGESDDAVLKYMKDVYYCSEEKASLSVDIAHYEEEILESISYDKGYSLYIGIPFCPSTCLYCSFTSFPISVYRKLVPRYIEAVKKEILYVRDAFKDKVLDSVYIGGGTPTTLEADELRDLITFLKANLDMSDVKEFTVEAGRADSITEEKLKTLYELGVSRISVNPQTMNEETLEFIGRKATAKATVEAYLLARKIGFDNINMDMIVGLPGEDEDTVEETLKEIKRLDPDSLTVHSLAIKRASRLAEKIDEMGYETIKNTDSIMRMTMEYTEAMGMKPYYLYRQKNMSGNFENVGYAKPGKAGIYNILIMEEKQSIVALGAGTVTKRVFPDGHRIERCDNVKDVQLYIDQIDEMIERKRRLFGL